MQIAAIDYELGSDQIPVEELGCGASLSADVIAQMRENGLVTIPTWAAEKRPVALKRFFVRLGRAHKTVLPSLDAVVVAKTHLGAHTLRPQSVLRWFAGGKPQQAVALEMAGQPCAILHSGVELARKILAASHRKKAFVLVVGCDVAASAVERCYFGSAMGDGCVAMLLSNRGAGATIVGSYVETNVIAPHGELSNPDDINRFRQQNAFWIRDAILKAFKIAGCSLDERCLILPHTPNRLIIEAVRQTLGLPPERMASDFMATTGHCCSNDSFITFARLRHSEKLRQYSMLALVNGGFGGTRGVTLIKP